MHVGGRDASSAAAPSGVAATGAHAASAVIVRTISTRAAADRSESPGAVIMRPTPAGRSGCDGAPFDRWEPA